MRVCIAGSRNLGHHFGRAPGTGPESPQRPEVAKGCGSREVGEWAERFALTAKIPRRGPQAHAAKRKAQDGARRYAVERAHSWMNRFRRILVRWEKPAKACIAMLHLVLAIIAWRCEGLLKQALGFLRHIPWHWHLHIQCYPSIRCNADA